MIIVITLAVIFVLLLTFVVQLKIHSINRLFLDDIQAAPSDFNLPSVTIIVAGRNEEAKIGSAVRSMAANDYPDLKVIAVDDRSDDKTGMILDDIASEQSNVKIVHVQDLPTGWLGKNHALQAGLDLSSSDWILFTDADINFSNEVLRKAIFYCLLNRIDHLAVYPGIQYGSPLEKSFVCVFGLLFAFDRPSWRVENPDSKKHIGIGAFNLIRKKCLDEVKGFHHINLSVDDDIRLGELLKAHGFRTKVAFGINQLSLKWQDDLKGYVKGFEKNAFGSLNYSIVKLTYSVFGVFVITILPFLAIVSAPPPGRLAALGIIILQWIILRDARRNSNISANFVFLIPIGGFLMMLSLLNSAYSTLKAGGISWRGTLYPVKELRQHVKERDRYVADIWRKNRAT